MTSKAIIAHFLGLGLFLFFLPIMKGQEPLILYDESHPSAKVLNCEFLEQVYFNKEKPALYPVVGAYTPTDYSHKQHGIDPNRGFCDYIYIPTDGKLKPGKQYTLSLTIKLDESYDQMSFYQDNFGLALTSYLWENRPYFEWGLWPHTIEPLGHLHGGELLTVELEFRPLCTSKYFVLGVFRGKTMDHLSCFACVYPFELHYLSIAESKNPERECNYFGDAFANSPTKSGSKEIAIYFDSGSAALKESDDKIFDSIPAQVVSDQDMILLSAFTDMSGSDNENLGAARNESVRQALVKRGIDNSKIITINHSDSKSAAVILSSDRRVEVDLGGGKVYKKLYMSALAAAEKEDFPTAHKLMMTEWLANIPSKKAIYALFDCWGESRKAEVFKAQLLEAIKSKFYKNQAFRFRLDSLHCEWLKGRTLSGNLYLNRMPGSKHSCISSKDSKRDSVLKKEADEIFSTYGFPDLKTVGRRANQVLPNIIISSDALAYLQHYLPLVKAACETGKLSWENYARLYDKVSILVNGYQRYGTKLIRDGKGRPLPEYPIEDESMVDEYRRQVKLAPLSQSIKENIKVDQDNLDTELVSLLNNIYKADQHHRNRINEANRGFKKWKATDSLNQIKVTKILDESGWLGPDVIGHRGNKTLFLVILHSDLNIQLKYLPMMRTAFIKDNAKGKDLAQLEDRVALRQGKKQTYGSQIYTDSETGRHFVAPIEDPESVNERRTRLGLGSIEDYVSRWNIVWDLAAHKKRH